jgi:ribonucleoside-diphosphate reductase alpha chain
VATFVSENSRKLNDAIDQTRNDLFEFFGIRTVYDRYLLKNPVTRDVIETPQFFWMRVACGLSETPAEAVRALQSFLVARIRPVDADAFQLGTKHEQLSSCFLLDRRRTASTASTESIPTSRCSRKFSGGIGIAYHRSRTGLVDPRNERHSNGIVPWLKTLDSSVAAVNQGGKRKGAAASISKLARRHRGFSRAA